MSQSAAFQQAVVDSKKLTSKPDNDTLLEFYGASASSSSTISTTPAYETMAMLPFLFMFTFPVAAIELCGLTLVKQTALYKIATGEDITKAPKPGMFDLKGKAKQSAWQKKVDEGLTPEQAQEKYVEAIEAAKAKFGFDANKEPEAVGA